MIEISQLKVRCGSGAKAVEEKIRRALRLKAEDAFFWEISRHSVDARKKPDLCDVYTVRVTLCTEGRKPSNKNDPGHGSSDKNGRLTKEGTLRPDGLGTTEKGVKGSSLMEEREAQLVRKCRNQNIRIAEDAVYVFPKTEPGAQRLSHRPVVVGSGPAGLFCALMLSRGGYRPILLERGKAMESRVRDVAAFFETGKLNPSSNVQFGEGGAGTFSDGKLTTGVKDRSGRIRFVLRTFVDAGAPEEILYENLPHIGTDRLTEVVVSMREEIRSRGGDVRFSSLVTDIVSREGSVTALRVLGPEGKEYELETEAVILAPGHSARDTIRMLYEHDVEIQQKNFAVGFRVSHPQSLINDAQYGVSSPEDMERLSLAPASYKLTAKASDGRGVYSFCMCPGGYVVNASSEAGGLVVNGMSDFARDSARANSAIVMAVSEDDFGSPHPLAGMSFQEKLERRAYRMADGRIPVESYEDFRNKAAGSDEKDREMSSRIKDEKDGEMAPADDGTDTDGRIYDGRENRIRPLTKEEGSALCIRGEAAYAPLHTLLPGRLTKAFTQGMEHFDHVIPGFAGDAAYVMGLESRTSSPVRILRDEGCESSLKGLYPCGEGAGYAGGIMSAAVDGIRVAEVIARKFSPPCDDSDIGTAF